MAESDGTTVNVDLVLAQVEELHVGERNDGESLVDLESVDSALLDTGVLQSLGDGEGRGGGELGGVLSGVSPSEDLADGLEVVLLESGLGDEDKGGSAVGKRGGVGGGDGSLLGLEAGPQSAGLALVELCMNQHCPL